MSNWWSCPRCGARLRWLREVIACPRTGCGFRTGLPKPVSDKSNASPGGL